MPHIINFDSREREREIEIPPVSAGNFPTGDFLGAAFFNLQFKEKTENRLPI